MLIRMLKPVSGRFLYHIPFKYYTCKENSCNMGLSQGSIIIEVSCNMGLPGVHL